MESSGDGRNAPDLTDSSDRSAIEISIPDRVPGFSYWEIFEEQLVASYLGGLDDGPCGTPIDFDLRPGPSLFARGEEGTAALVRVLATTDRDPRQVFDELAADIGASGCRVDVPIPGSPDSGTAEIVPLALVAGVGWRSEEVIGTAQTYSVSAFLNPERDKIIIVQLTQQEVLQDDDLGLITGLLNDWVTG